MPFALVIIGLVMVIAGVKDTQDDLAKQLKTDFSGDNNFFYWIASIGAVGALGYIDALRTFSRVLMGLIVLVMFLSNGGFFDKFQSAIANVQASKPASPESQGSASGVLDTLSSIASGTDSVSKNVNAINDTIGAIGGVLGNSIKNALPSIW